MTLKIDEALSEANKISYGRRLFSGGRGYRLTAGWLRFGWRHRAGGSRVGSGRHGGAKWREAGKRSQKCWRPPMAPIHADGGRVKPEEAVPSADLVAGGCRRHSLMRWLPPQRNRVESAIYAIKFSINDLQRKHPVPAGEWFPTQLVRHQETKSICSRDPVSGLKRFNQTVAVMGARA